LKPSPDPVNHFSVAEEIWHAVTHGIGFILSITALALLVAHRLHKWYRFLRERQNFLFSYYLASICDGRVYLTVFCHTFVCAVELKSNGTSNSFEEKHTGPKQV